jgi:hypothetical protein
MTPSLAISRSADPDRVFVPLAEVKSISATLEPAAADSASLANASLAADFQSGEKLQNTDGAKSDPPWDTSASSAIHNFSGGSKSASFRPTANEMRDALTVLPRLANAMADAAKLAEENQRLKAENAALQATKKSLVGEGDAGLKEEVQRLALRAETLRSALNTTKRALKGKSKSDSPSSTPPHPQLDSIDPERITALAIALTEGAAPPEIAGQMFDEMDRVNSGPGHFKDDGCAIEGTERARRACQVTANKVHELEGVVEVSLSRIAALEQALGGSGDVWTL